MEEEKDYGIRLLDAQDVENITGWSPATVQTAMNSSDFPVIKVGKRNQVLLESFKEWLSKQRILRGE